MKNPNTNGKKSKYAKKAPHHRYSKEYYEWRRAVQTGNFPLAEHMNRAWQGSVYRLQRKNKRTVEFDTITPTKRNTDPSKQPQPYV